MAQKVTLITRCSNAEEELITYAQEADLAPQFFSTRRHQQIQAWTQVQSNQCVTQQVGGRSRSVITKDNNQNLCQKLLYKCNKQQLKFKLRHYNDSTCDLDVLHDLKSLQPNKEYSKERDDSSQATKNLEMTEKKRNFSISRPKRKGSKCDKTVSGFFGKTIRDQSFSKQKASRPVKLAFFPVSKDFELYEEQQKLSLKLKQYLKKCSVRFVL